ncbi:hypothetical protein BD410DRAFT_897781 [Rickenella mellea]|uniref:Fungal-type protein kinase domain-containing protein n=1 Tax=Rickenella mellea TaxID=50990 RepID=A0A4Y7Q7M2_9AGAM|nr:hypothetical protein BD410DRAFT_897781 [Rickenella mellea]
MDPPANTPHSAPQAGTRSLPPTKFPTNNSQVEQEWKLLGELECVDNVARMLEHEVLKFRGVQVDGSAETHLSFIKGAHEIDIWNHVRAIVTPFGKPIYYFRNKRELLQAFVNIVKAYRDLCEYKLMMHNDISLRHILLVDSYDSVPEYYCPGLLIDFDVTMKNSDAATILPKDLCTGTVPFMAIRTLLGTATNDATHDLESFFYVFCWICIIREGCDYYRKDFKFEDSCLEMWTGRPSDSHEDIGYRKLGIVPDADFVESSILNEFHPCFHCLRTCAMGLWGILFSSFSDSKPNLHEDIITAFQETLDGLPVGCRYGDDALRLASDERNGEIDTFDKQLYQARNPARAGTDDRSEEESNSHA